MAHHPAQGCPVHIAGIGGSMNTGKVAVDCWNCCEGELSDTCTCGDDTCCCLEPEPETCGECRGTGVLWVSPEHAENV
jgi:hypothetical protein